LDVIELITTSKSPESIFEQSTIDEQYKKYARQVHPDIIGSNNAMVQLNLLRDKAVKKRDLGIWYAPTLNSPSFIDDSGDVYFSNKEILYLDNPITTHSVACYKSLAHLPEFSLGDTKGLKMYLPKSVEDKKVLYKDNVNVSKLYKTWDPAFLLGGQRWRKNFPNGLPDKHVAWIASRLYEFLIYIHKNNLVHCGLTPTSVFVCPDTHIVQVSSFYHMRKNGEGLKTISAKYQSWYPSSIFGSKKASKIIDLEMVNHLVLSILDKSSAHLEFIKWFEQVHVDINKDYPAYRELLKKIHGAPKFHKLEL
jgi:hypothetical protein